MHAPQSQQEVYADPQQLWTAARGGDGTHRDWYAGAVSFWDAQEASYDGVLGGFGHVSDADINDSRAVLLRVWQHTGSPSQLNFALTRGGSGSRCPAPSTVALRCCAGNAATAAGGCSWQAEGESHRCGRNMWGHTHMLHFSMRWAAHCSTTPAETPAQCCALCVIAIADCGAGVGRVSEQLLLHHFSEVDLLEPSRHLLDAAVKNLKAAVAAGTYPPGHSVGVAMCHGLQEFRPPVGHYDCIWIQWCLLYLTDGECGCACVCVCVSVCVCETHGTRCALLPAQTVSCWAAQHHICLPACLLACLLACLPQPTHTCRRYHRALPPRHGWAA
jgi:AdoMet dependent proline di-methyltransferase